MNVTLKDSQGQIQTLDQWAKSLLPEDRKEMYQALAPYMGTADTGPVSLEKFRRDFSNLCNEDRKAFMKTMQEAIAFAHAAMNETEFDHALQAELDRRNQIAADAAWDKSVADAKARQEKAKREVAL
jgi:hypothetical protein